MALNVVNQGRDSVEIINFSDELKQHIKTLNYEWLEKYFVVEPRDVVELSNPKAYIIDKGGFIFYAKLRGEIVGTVALLKQTDAVFELGKMAVTDKAQGYGIGKALIEHCFEIAKQQNIRMLILYSNRKLASAIHLYKKYGFIETELEQGIYERADIKMCKQF